MKNHLQIAVLSVQFLMSLGAWQPATAQPSSTFTIGPSIALTSEQVVNKLVQRNLERAQRLAAYQGTRIYRLEHHGLLGSRSAEMIVAVKYRSPGTKEFSILSEKGSHLVIEKVFYKLLESEKEAISEENQARIALNNDNYRFALAGYQSMPTGPCYVLSVAPLTKNKLLYRGRIWVDAEDFAVVRIEAATREKPFLLDQRNQDRPGLCQGGRFLASPFQPKQ